MIITKHPTSVIKIISITAVCVAIVIGVLLHFQSISRAADLSKFDPGNIMSDAVMSNKSTMSVQQIQAFLDSKNPCDNKNTYMAGWYPHLSYTIRDGKFVCMAKDSFNGKSAAQIIWQAGQDYSINPQVLLVLLEKEQGLISDTWPNNVQYRTATGFGCPDTAPCEAQYFGLENQVRLAANLFRTVLNGGWSNYPVGQTYVQYHPESSCGGTVVNIQNRATSALYRYTPYQPNRAALSAGYGTGDGCSAYGNRNFYALFTDWFGSTKITTSIDKQSYLKIDGTNYIFFSTTNGVFATYWGNNLTQNKKITIRINDISLSNDLVANYNATSGLFQVFTATDTGVYETYWGKDQTNYAKVTGLIANVRNAKSIQASVSGGLSQVFTATDTGVYETYWGKDQTNYAKVTGLIANVNSLY